MQLYSNRWRTNAYYRLLAICNINFSFSGFGVLIRVFFLNPFEGLSFSVNLSDLVCSLNVKESILFYSVQYLRMNQK